MVYVINPANGDNLYDNYYDGAGACPGDYREGSSDHFLSRLFAINQERIAEIAGIKPVGRLLDIGCGQGYFLQTARRYGYEVRGIDVSMTAVTHAREKLGPVVDSCTLHELAGSGLHFDIITMWHVLEHLPNPIASLDLAVSLLAPGGLCAIEVPNLYSLKFLTTPNKWHGQGGSSPQYHLTFFTNRTLRRVLEKAGFKRISRVMLDYEIPGRNRLYKSLKAVLNRVGLDTSLSFIAYV